MLIGIDASRALKRQRTGTEVHNAEIIKALIKIDDENRYRLYSSRPPEGDMEKLETRDKIQDSRGKIEWRVMPWPRGWTIIRLSWEMIWHKPDVLFVPAHALPLFCSKRSVVMIHDIGFDHYPKLYNFIDKIYHRYAIQFAKRFAGHIITPSEYTRQDLHRTYAIPLNKMTVVHHGFDKLDFRPTQSGEKSPRNVPYFYYVGRLEYKKNVARMIEAFGQFKLRTGLPHQFLLAGKPGFGYETINAAIAKLPESVQQDIVQLGYIHQSEATQYLRHAQALVFCTLFEGFGFPVLEAFASSTPVIASNTTSLPEIVGDAGIVVNPVAIDEIASAMTRIATDSKLRNQIISTGNQRLSQFSWERAAKETLAILNKVAQNA